MRRESRSAIIQGVVLRTGDLLTTGEAARLLRCSRAYVASLCLRGLMPYVKVGTQRRVRRADVEALIEPGILSEPERRTVLAAFAESRRDHARPMRPEKLEQVLRSV